MESSQDGATQRLLLRIPEVAETLGIGRTKIYEMIATGELPTVRFGRAVRISVTTLQKWVEEREQQNMPSQYQNDAQRSKIQKERTLAWITSTKQAWDPALGLHTKLRSTWTPALTRLFKPTYYLFIARSTSSRIFNENSSARKILGVEILKKISHYNSMLTPTRIRLYTAATLKIIVIANDKRADVIL